MQTYHYRFPATGKIEESTRQDFTKELEKKLSDGYECLMAYCIFPAEGATLDHVSFGTDGSGNVSAIDIHTYSKLWDGMEDDFKECVDNNLAEISLETFGDEQAIAVTGDVEFLGREGDIPKTLYYITTEKNMNRILFEGLIPNIGPNNYKNQDKKIFLTSADDAAAWIAILKHKDNARLIEVNTEGLELEMGRMFNDRGFVQGGKYTEYTSTETIPSSALKAADFGKGSNELATVIRGNMLEQLNLAVEPNEIAEVKTGLERIAGMGLLKQEQVEAVVKGHVDFLKEYGNIADRSYDNQDDTPPWDENDNGRNPEWEKEAGEDLEQAMQQMTLADFGIKID